MKNMYAIKCLYQSKFYSMDNKLLDANTFEWEERIILIKASSMEEADLKSEKTAKEYESEYVNIYNEIVKVRLYQVIDIFVVFDIFLVLLMLFSFLLCSLFLSYFVFVKYIKYLIVFIVYNL